MRAESYALSPTRSSPEQGQGIPAHAGLIPTVALVKQIRPSDRLPGMPHAAYRNGQDVV